MEWELGEKDSKEGIETAREDLHPYFKMSAYVFQTVNIPQHLTQL
jgi:hypothetical protein